MFFLMILGCGVDVLCVVGVWCGGCIGVYFVLLVLLVLVLGELEKIFCLVVDVVFMC